MEGTMYSLHMRKKIMGRKEKEKLSFVKVAEMFSISPLVVLVVWTVMQLVKG